MRKVTIKTILYLILQVFIINCSGQQIDYFDTNYNLVFENSGKNNKMVFIDFYTHWCGPCKQFERVILHDSIFRDYISSNFYTTKINAEIEENKKIVKRYDISGYPTFIITKPNGEEIDRIVGLSSKDALEFVSLIRNIIAGNDRLSYLQKMFYSKPDSIELFRKVIKDKLLAKKQYNEAIEICNFAICHSSNDLIKTEAEFFHAYSMIKNPFNSSPVEIKNFVKRKNIDSKYIEFGYNELNNYYFRQNILDSINYYCNILIKINSQNHFIYIRDYAEFLYKQNKNIALGDSLTKEYAEHETNYTDHWTPYLKANSLARHGNKGKGLELFDIWMNEYSKPENFKEDIWHYYYYVEFSIFYEVKSDNAVKYAEMLEAYKSSIENKKRLAKLYMLQGAKDNALVKLVEIKGLYEDPVKKEEIDKLINEYKRL